MFENPFATVDFRCQPIQCHGRSDGAGKSLCRPLILAAGNPQLGRDVKPIRPKFENPPLIERAITIAFRKLEGLTLGDYGLFWSRLRGEFPISEVASPIVQELETYDGPKIAQPQIQLLAENTLPRGLFRNPEKGELIQLQPDRFSFNWIKTGSDHSYPHSETVLTRFFTLFSEFAAFVNERELGEIVPTQCELTNVNVIPVSDVGESFTDIATVMKIPDLGQQYDCLRLESQLVGAKHLIVDEAGNSIGRVHSLGQPTLQVSTSEQAFRFDIVARGAPIGSGMKGVEAFLDRAVSAVNAVFLSSVTSAGRQFWGEVDGK